MCPRVSVIERFHCRWVGSHKSIYTCNLYAFKISVLFCTRIVNLALCRHPATPIREKRQYVCDSSRYSSVLFPSLRFWQLESGDSSSQSSCNNATSTGKGTWEWVCECGCVCVCVRVSMHAWSWGAFPIFQCYRPACFFYSRIEIRFIFELSCMCA